MCFSANGLEGLHGRCLLTVAGHEVVHHSNERLVLILVVVHHGTEHLEDIGTLGVNQVLVGAFGTGRNQAQAHPQRAGVVRSHAIVVLFQNPLAQPLPKFDVVLSPV